MKISNKLRQHNNNFKSNINKKNKKSIQIYSVFKMKMKF